MNDPPYSSSLGPGDFHLFQPLKQHLAGKGFARHQHEASCHLLTTGTDKDYFCTGIQATFEQILKCQRCYTEVWCVPSTYRLPGTHCSQNKIFGISLPTFWNFLIISATEHHFLKFCSKFINYTKLFSPRTITVKVTITYSRAGTNFSGKYHIPEFSEISFAILTHLPILQPHSALLQNPAMQN